MSAPDPGLSLAGVGADVVELAAFRGRHAAMQAVVQARSLQLPPLGRALMTSTHCMLSVRPDRWLSCSTAGAPGAAVAGWQSDLGETGAAIDQSSGLSLLHLAGPAARDVLARSCRLDLHPAVFASGAAASTLIAQVPAILVALSTGLLLLTPASTARHMNEWLEMSARPFGVAALPALALSSLLMKEIA